MVGWWLVGGGGSRGRGGGGGGSGSGSGGGGGGHRMQVILTEFRCIACGSGVVTTRLANLQPSQSDNKSESIAKPWHE